MRGDLPKEDLPVKYFALSEHLDTGCPEDGFKNTIFSKLYSLGVYSIPQNNFKKN